MHQLGAVRRRAEALLRETRPDEFSPREALELLSRLKGLVVSRPGSGSLVDRTLLRTTRLEVVRRPDLRRQGIDIAKRQSANSLRGRTRK